MPDAPGINEIEGGVVERLCAMRISHNLLLRAHLDDLLDVGMPRKADAQPLIESLKGEVLGIKLLRSQKTPNRISQARVKADHVRFPKKHGRKASKIFFFFFREHVPCPQDGLSGIGTTLNRLQFVDGHQIVVAMNACDPRITKKGQRLARKAVVPDEIAQADDLLNRSSPYVGQDGLQRLIVGVDVGNDRESHNRTHPLEDLQALLCQCPRSVVLTIELVKTILGKQHPPISKVHCIHLQKCPYSLWLRLFRHVNVQLIHLLYGQRNKIIVPSLTSKVHDSILD